MNQRRIEEWKKLDHEKLRKYMRYDYKSSALYQCGKNISQLTKKEKYLLILIVFNNFFRSGYSKYGYFFSNLYIETFKDEINDVGQDKIDRYLSKCIMKINK